MCRKQGHAPWTVETTWFLFDDMKPERQWPHAVPIYTINSYKHTQQFQHYDHSFLELAVLIWLVKHLLTC